MPLSPVESGAANQAIVVQDIGGGASRVTIGAVETGRLVLRQFSSDGAALAARSGLEVHAGHGLTFENVSAIAAIGEVVELNIGHFIVGEAVFAGLEATIRQMRAHMDAAR